MKANNRVPMKKISLYLLLILQIVVSCKKSDTPVVENPFSYCGVQYHTLQAAVDAVETSKSWGESVICLEGDASGAGAVFPEGDCLQIVLDLKSHKYTLDSGASIDAGNNNLLVCGNGGELVASGSAPVLKGADGAISISGRIVLNGENVLSSSSEVCIESDFTGCIYGNVFLQEAGMNLLSSQCQIIVPVFSALGETSGFFADTDAASPSIVARLSKVVSDQAYPVSSVCKGVVAVTDGDVHIHNFKAVEHPGTCLSVKSTEYVCEDCGYSYAINASDYNFGSCDVSALVHHARVDADSIIVGNVEYWQCPDCGRCYADRNAEKELDKVFIIPELLDDMESLLGDYSNGFPFDITLQQFIEKTISLLVSVGLGIPKLLKSEAQYWKEVHKDLDDIIRKVDELSQQVHLLARDVKNVPYKVRIMNRYDDLDQLKDVTLMAFENIETILNSKETDVQKTEKIKKVLKDWGQFEVGSSKSFPYNLTYSLMKNYGASSVDVSYPAMYGEFVNTFAVWEHEGYDYRLKVMANDLAIVGLSYWLTRLYNKEIKYFASEESRNSYLAILEKSFRDDYSAAIKNEINRMKSRDTKYRRLNASFNVTFDRQMPGPVDVYDWISSHRDKHFPRNNKNNVAVRSCNEMLASFGMDGRTLFSDSQARFIQEYYNRGKFTSFLDYTLTEKAKFTYAKSALSNGTVMFVPNRQNNFGHDNNDSALPNYKIFRWESFKSHKNKDSFGAYCFDEFNCKQIVYHKFTNGSNIKTSSGYFSRVGSKSDKPSMSTVLVAKE